VCYDFSLLARIIIYVYRVIKSGSMPLSVVLINTILKWLALIDSFSLKLFYVSYHELMFL
jgi:hypothetical protein